MVLIHGAPAFICRVLSWLQSFAEERSLEWQQDSTGNMVIRRPGSAGGERAGAVVIQGEGGSRQLAMC